jgi:hypothetical protein
MSMSAIEAGAALGMHVDHRGGLVAVLRGQSTGQEVDTLGEARIVNLAEVAADPLRELYAVDAVLDVGVLAAHVDLTVGILRHARRLQDHLVEGSIVALRQALERLTAEVIDAAPGFR